MKKFFNWIFEWIGLRKVIRFKQLSDYTLNESTTASDIKQILVEAADNVQFHVGIEDEIFEGDKCATLLIQRDLVEKDFFLVCKMLPYDMTPWKKVYVDDLVQLIYTTKTSECRKFEKWNVITRAIEGKTFGEYESGT